MFGRARQIFYLTKTGPSMAIDLQETQTSSGSDEFLKGVWKQNPIFVQVLGMCPVLAVSNSARNALAMGLATAFVLVMSNIVVASIRHVVPKQVRIVTFILVIATFVTVVDYCIGNCQSFEIFIFCMVNFRLYRICC